MQTVGSSNDAGEIFGTSGKEMLITQLSKQGFIHVVLARRPVTAHCFLPFRAEDAKAVMRCMRVSSID